MRVTLDGRRHLPLAWFSLLCHLNSPQLIAGDVSALAEVRSAPLAPYRTILSDGTSPDATPSQLDAWAKWKQSPMFQVAFEPNLIAMPDAQLQYLRSITSQDFQLYRKILDEAIELRNKIAPSARLLAKYGVKVLSMLIKRRNDEMKISPRIKPDARFFDSLAGVFEEVLARSKELKQGLRKDSIDVNQFRLRVLDLFDYIQRLLNTSPVGLYVKLDETRVYMDDLRNERHGVTLIAEASDLLAQFRTMGFESAMSWAKRLVKLIRSFASGRQVSSADEVPE